MTPRSRAPSRTCGRSATSTSRGGTTSKSSTSTSSRSSRRASRSSRRRPSSRSCRCRCAGSSATCRTASACCSDSTCAAGPELTRLPRPRLATMTSSTICARASGSRGHAARHPGGRSRRAGRGGAGGNQVYTLQSAEEPYRTLVEQMQEGAVILTTTATSCSPTIASPTWSPGRSNR